MSAFRRFRRSRRFWLAGATLVVVALFGVVAVTTSGAAGPCPIPGNFEIDGNMTEQTCTPGADDWNTQNIGVVGTNQGGTYSTAGKDGSDPSTWTSTGSTPDKTNFAQAYATSRTVQVNGSPHFFVFVAWERTFTSGTQGYAIELSNAGANVAADGTPQPNRSQGGFVFYISSTGGSAPTFDSSCSYTSQSDYGSTCSNSQAGFYSAFNSADFTDPLSGLPVGAGGFYEVALDVTTLTGIVPSCPGATAATVYLRSVTGQSKNGNLKGYMAPLEVAPNSTCVPPPISTTATPGGSQSAIGSSQHDTVTVGTQEAPGIGSVQFFLCSPAEVAANGGDCSANGTQVGSAATLTNGQASSDTVNGASTPNDNAPGKYCWRAEFTPSSDDHNYLPGSETNSLATGAAGDECFVVVKNTTLIGTAASSQTIGAAIHDVATLSGATANAGGTITFNLYGPSATPVCSGTPVYTNTVNVSGPGNYNSGDFTPTTAGKYYWIASYSGDVNNESSSGTCGDSGETSTIGKQPTGISTAATSGTLGAAIHDVATLSGATANAGGTITFNLYGPSATPVCSGTPVYTNTVNVSGPGDYNSGDFTPTAAGKYYWIASYSGDVNNQAASGKCGDSGETSTIAKRPTSIATAATSAAIGNAVHDVATLSGASADAGGTITFNLYGPSDTPDCSGDAVFTATVNVNGNGDYNSGNFTPSTAGAYYWIASYSGDSNNLPSTGSCGDNGETSTIGKQPTSIVTAATSGTIGGTVSDTATLSDATEGAGGTITFNLYGPSEAPDCSGEPVYTNTVEVDGNGDYSSGDFTPATAGTYYWIASYSGDSNNVSSSGKCGDDGETSTVAKQPTGIATAATSGSVGDAVHDVATLSGGYSPGGTITFNLYGPSDTPDCSGEPVFSDTVSVDGNGDYQSGDFTPDRAGTYYWIASYSGDVNNLPSTGTCGDEGETSTIRGASIHIVKTADAAKVNVGSPIGFTLTVSNSGDGIARDVTLTDTLPSNPGLSWTIASQGSGWGKNPCSISSGVLTCGPQDVPANTTQANSTFTVHITSTTTAAAGGDCPGSGTVDNTGKVTASNDGSDQSSASTCVQALVDLSVTKAGSPATQDLGQGNITWAIVVTNNGPNADTGVTIADPMPPGNTFVSATSTQGTCTGGAILNCTIGTMAAGAKVTITLVTTPSAAGTQTNTVTVAGNRPETNTANNQATATVQVTKAFVPPPVYCVAVSKVTPNQLFVGRKTKLTIRLTKHGKAVKGIRVRIKGPKLNVTTKRSNAKGTINQTVKMKKAGIMIFSPIASKRCNTKRIGVTGVFTPPVTG